MEIFLTPLAMATALGERCGPVWISGDTSSSERQASRACVIFTSLSDMNDRSENSLQTAARWGRNALIGVGVTCVLFKFATAWIGMWYRLFPGIRRHLERRYGREQAFIEFVSRGIGLLLALPMIAFTVFAVVALLDDQLQLGFAAWWEKLWAVDGSNPGEFLFWIGFLVMLPWVVSSSVEMLRGLKKSIRPHNDKCRSRPPVSRFTLYLCFYLLAVPIFLLILMVDDEPFIYTQRAWVLIVTVSLWMPMRWFCGKLMRHTGSLGRLVTAFLLAVMFTPVAARLIGLTGFYGTLCDGLCGLG